MLLQKDGTDLYQFFVKQEKYDIISEAKRLLTENEMLADIKSSINAINQQMGANTNFSIQATHNLEVRKQNQKMKPKTINPETDWCNLIP